MNAETSLVLFAYVSLVPDKSQHLVEWINE